MSNHYPHHDLVQAWLAGEDIQYLANGEWRTMPNASVAEKMPHFYRDQGYRRLPKVLRYRLAVVRHVGRKHGVEVVEDLAAERSLSAAPHFVRWLTEWAEEPV